MSFALAQVDTHSYHRSPQEPCGELRRDSGQPSPRLKDMRVWRATGLTRVGVPRPSKQHPPGCSLLGKWGHYSSALGFSLGMGKLPKEVLCIQYMTK